MTNMETCRVLARPEKSCRASLGGEKDLLIGVANIYILLLLFKKTTLPLQKEGTANCGGSICTERVAFLNSRELPGNALFDNKN